MAIRFHKRFRIAPGLTLNLNKKSVSVRAGVKNAGFTAGTAGTTRSVSVPGTGLAFVDRRPNAASKPAQAAKTAATGNDPAAATGPQAKPLPRAARVVLGIAFALTALSVLCAGVILWIVTP